ncbi:MAG: hypothetical protein KDC82_06700 [Bacteroidetes bacterium]|nr:hypothetical protein [Bacteroidota bacterium]
MKKVTKIQIVLTALLLLSPFAVQIVFAQPGPPPPPPPPPGVPIDGGILLLLGGLGAYAAKKFHKKA